MVASLPPGRPGTLTPDQEAKLRELWALVLRVFGVFEPGSSSSTPTGNSPDVSGHVTADTTSNDSSRRKTGKRMSLFRKKRKEGASEDSAESESSSTATTTSSASTSVSDIANGMTNDKHDTAKNFRAAIAGASPAELREAFWSMVKHDHPDALLLRFLRARKWDINAALVMTISALHWRSAEAKVDSDVIFRGEEGMLNLTKNIDPAKKKEGEDFMQQIRMGKSFLHGVDKEGRPICYVRVRLHKPGEQSEASLERFTVFTIETARMFLRPPVDTATIVFDMTDFGMANMDYTPLKFMIKCFEANYPESLGRVLVHKAPWVFQGVYRVIKGWLDPVVAAKVHFTNSLEDLEKLIPKEGVIKELGGSNPWSYTYPEPQPGENSLMSDTLTKQRFEGERADLARKYEDTILEWISSTENTISASADNIAELRKKRDDIAAELRKNYWKLDPYVRARSLYDRSRELRPEITADGEKGDVDLARSTEASTLAVSFTPVPHRFPPVNEQAGRPSIDSLAQSFRTAKETCEDDLD